MRKGEGSEAGRVIGTGSQNAPKPSAGGRHAPHSVGRGELRRFWRERAVLKK